MAQKVTISRFDITDAELSTPDGDTVSIPREPNDELIRQLDGWDRDTSVPATIDGKDVEFTLDHYDNEKECWILRKSA